MHLVSFRGAATLKCYNRRIGLVGQEPVLFSGTIGENIRMGRRDGVSTEEMLKSSEMANAAEFISKVS